VGEAAAVAVDCWCGVVALALIGIYDRSGYDISRLAGTTSETTTPTPSASTAETPATEPVDQPVAEPTQPGVLALGDPATVPGDITGAGVITVRSLKITTRAYDTSVGSKPRNGYFLIFTVSFKADGYFDIFEDDFYVKTSNGERIDEGGGNSWDAVDFYDLLDLLVVNAGERRTGLVVFDSPVKHGVLAYAPNAKGNPIVSWKF
jgi:hypothetical protein